MVNYFLVTYAWDWYEHFFQLTKTIVGTCTLVLEALREILNLYLIRTLCRKWNRTIKKSDIAEMDQVSLYLISRYILFTQHMDSLSHEFVPVGIEVMSPKLSLGRYFIRGFQNLKNIRQFSLFIIQTCFFLRKYLWVGT